MSLADFSTAHTHDAANSQTYWQHMGVAFWASFRLIALGLGGIWHAIFPEHRFFQFWTSTGVIRIYRELELSGRHDDEIERIFSSDRKGYIECHRGQ